MGVYPENLPGFQSYSDNKDKFGKAWNCDLPDGGLDADAILQGIEAGTIHFLYLAATNPRNFPNSSRWMKALEKVEILVVQDIFPSDVTRLATVVLPGCSYAEKPGSFTSLDQVVRSFDQAIRPVGQSREDLEIFAELYGRLNKTTYTLNRADLSAEISELTTLYTDAEFLDDERNTCLLRLPQVDDGGLKYQLITAGSAAEGLQLLTGTSSGHFGTTSTWAPAPLEVEPEGVLQLNTEDAKTAGVADGDTLKLTSSTGATVGKILISESVPQGLIFAPHNFTALGIQQLMADGDNLTAVEMVKV